MIKGTLTFLTEQSQSALDVEVEEVFIYCFLESSASISPLDIMIDKGPLSIKVFFFPSLFFSALTLNLSPGLQFKVSLSVSKSQILHFKTFVLLDKDFSLGCIIAFTSSPK